MKTIFIHRHLESRRRDRLRRREVEGADARDARRQTPQSRKLVVELELMALRDSARILFD